MPMQAQKIEPTTGVPLLAKIAINGVIRTDSEAIPVSTISGSGYSEVELLVIPYKKLVKKVRAIPAIIISTKNPHFFATPS